MAALAKVSPITVSRALRGERAVAIDLTDRVKAAALKLGYTPDPAARALIEQSGIPCVAKCAHPLEKVKRAITPKNNPRSHEELRRNCCCSEIT